MKQKFSNYLIFSFLSIVLLFSNSCKKTDTPDTSTASAIDCVNAENYFCDIKNIADEAGLKNGSFNGILNDSLITVSYDTINHSDIDTITISFGTNNITCQDGRLRKGKIITTYNGKYSDTAKTHVIKLYNFYVDNSNVTGTIKDSYKGYNSSGHQNFADTVNGSIIYNTGKTLNWNSTSKLAYTAGDSSSVWSNRIMIINGNSYGIASDGDGFSSLISTPLLKNFSSGGCRKYLTKGVIQIAISNKSYRAADLGDGTCDNSITVGIDGNNYQVNTN